MAFCTNCGTKLTDGSKFCPSCGTPVEGEPQESKAPPAPAPTSHVDAGAVARAAADAAVETAAKVAVKAAAGATAGAAAVKKAAPVFKRNPKLLGIAALAVVAALLLLSRCVGGGSGNGDKAQDQIQGYWAMATQVYGDAAEHVERPWNIGVTENAIQLDGLATCSMADAEYKKDGLYFSAQWYDSDPGDGRQPGTQDYDLRMTYSKKNDLLTLEVKVSNKWYALGEYTRTN